MKILVISLLILISTNCLTLKRQHNVEGDSKPESNSQGLSQSQTLGEDQNITDYYPIIGPGGIWRDTTNYTLLTDPGFIAGGFQDVPLDNLSSTETDIDQFVRSKVPSLAEAKLVGLTEQVVSGTIYCYSYSDASEEKSSADAEEANDQHDEETKGSDAEGPSSNSEDSSSEGEEADAETVEICVNSIPWQNNYLSFVAPDGQTFTSGGNNDQVDSQ